MKFTFEETNYAQVLRKNAIEQGKIEASQEIARNLSVDVKLVVSKSFTTKQSFKSSYNSV